MIVNIDHIGLSSTNFKQHHQLLTGLGYEKVLQEDDLENLNIKKPYLTKFNETHSLALYRKDKVYGIELLNHGQLTEQPGFIYPYNKDDSAELSENSILNTCVVASNDIGASTKFWATFGFLPDGTQDNMTRLRFNAMTTGLDYYLLLRHIAGEYKYYMDTKGFNSIAFISSSVDKEKRKIDRKEYPTSRIDQITVNDRLLDIFFVTGPSGEIVEIISYA